MVFSKKSPFPRCCSPRSRVGNSLLRLWSMLASLSFQVAIRRPLYIRTVIRFNPLYQERKHDRRYGTIAYRSYASMDVDRLVTLVRVCARDDNRAGVRGWGMQEPRGDAHGRASRKRSQGIPDRPVDGGPPQPGGPSSIVRCRCCTSILV
jgi:hypothetical protein